MLSGSGSNGSPLSGVKDTTIAIRWLADGDLRFISQKKGIIIMSENPGQFQTATLLQFRKKFMLPSVADSDRKKEPRTSQSSYKTESPLP